MESLDGGFLYRLDLQEEIRAYLAVPRPDFVRLSEEEVDSLTTQPSRAALAKLEESHD